MKSIIRPATEDDLEICEKLLNSPEFLTADGKSWTKEWLSKYLGDNCFFVSVFDKKVIGCIVGEFLKQNGAVVWLLVVDTKFRNMGIGSKLLSTFELKAKEQNRDWVVLYATIYNEKTVRFYRKQKYSIGDKLIECLKVLN